MCPLLYTNTKPGERNYRNGYSQKNLRSSFGDVDLDIPRDRKSEFEPQIVKKYETVCNELDKKIISLWSYVNILDTKSQTFLCCTSS